MSGNTPCLSWPATSSGVSPISAAIALAAASGSSLMSVECTGLLLAPGVDHLGMRVGELGRTPRPRSSVGLPSLASWRLVIRSLPRLAQLVQRRQPRVGGVDVTAIPRRQNGLRLQVDELNVVGRQAVLRQRGQQAVVRRRRERCADPLAPQVGDRVDAGSVAGHQRLVVACDVEHERHLVGNVQRRGEAAGHGAGTQRAEVEFLGDERGVDVGAGVELDPLDVVVGQRLFEPLVVLDDQVAARKGLVADANASACRPAARTGRPRSRPTPAWPPPPQPVVPSVS